jgi:hypothetical protein
MYGGQYVEGAIAIANNPNAMGVLDWDVWQKVYGGILILTGTVIEGVAIWGALSGNFSFAFQAGGYGIGVISSGVKQVWDQ